MASGHAADHFIPATLHQVRSLLQQRLADTGTQRTMDLLVSVLRGESDRRADRLKLLHEQALGAREAGNDEASAALIGEFDTALAETLASMGTARVVMREGKGAMGMSNLTTFLRPVSEGTVHASARAIHRGRTTWVWEVELRDDADRLCATSRVTIAVRER